MKKILAATILCFCPFQSSAFTLVTTDSEYRGWQNPEVTFNVNTANCPASVDVPGLITEAASVWNNIATSRVKISYSGATTSTAASNPVTIYCETNFSGYGDVDTIPAVAGPGSVGHYAVVGIMRLNASAGAANIASFNRELLLVIIAHEMGHVLGLGHSQDPSALMYYNAGAKTNFALAQDDIDGMTYLYPRDELGDDKMMGCGQVASTSPKPPRGSLLAILAVLMLLPLSVYTKLRFS